MTALSHLRKSCPDLIVWSCASEGCSLCVDGGPQNEIPPLNVPQNVYCCLSPKCHVDSVYLYLNHSVHACMSVCMSESNHDDSQLIQLLGTR